MHSTSRNISIEKAIREWLEENDFHAGKAELLDVGMDTYKRRYEEQVGFGVKEVVDRGEGGVIVKVADEDKAHLLDKAVMKKAEDDELREVFGKEWGRREKAEDTSLAPGESGF